MTITSYHVVEGDGVRNYLEKIGVRQSPITPDPLPYQMVKQERFNVTESVAPGYGPLRNIYGLNVCNNAAQIQNFAIAGSVYASLPMDLLYNQTYEKFISSMKGSVAEVAVNLAERQEALLMMLNRLVRITNAVRAFRQFHFKAAARHLGVLAPSSAQRKRWSGSRQWSANWLEWHFGWSPLVKDIYSAVEILDASFPWFSVKESSGWKLENNFLQNPGGGTFSDKFRGVAVCKISAEVEISDLTLFKANQLGLINPASVVWELIPFSFLADWFGTIGLWLSSFTDFCGLTVRRPQHVYFIRGTGHLNYRRTGTTSDLNFDYSVAAVVRNLGIPGPTVAFRRLKALSVTRGLTAIALILGLFAPK
jgi:hypothetical protein